MISKIVSVIVMGAPRLSFSENRAIMRKTNCEKDSLLGQNVPVQKQLPILDITAFNPRHPLIKSLISHDT